MQVLPEKEQQLLDNCNDILSEYLLELEERTFFHAGYPYNLNYDYSELLPFLNFTLSNVGDPYSEVNYKINSRQLEIECIKMFADMYNIDSHWGYVTACGTEGNLYGLFLGREVCQNAVLYFSRDTHYSVKKAAKLYQIPQVIIDSQENGEIDYNHLSEQIGMRRERGAIVNINIGTTVKGAFDSIDKIVDILLKKGVEFYIHCDGALGGLLLPYIDDAPKIDFEKYPIGSLSISGHKFIGCPFPCGIVITRPGHVQKVENSIEYIGSKDTTIMGSRNGLAALFLWYAMKKRAHLFGVEVQQCLKNAKYLYNRLKEKGGFALLNNYSTTVVFDKPTVHLCNKWQLATQGNLAHIVVMQNITTDKIDAFINDLESVSQEI